MNKNININIKKDIETYKNNTNTFLYLRKLPNDIKTIIFSYIPKIITIFLNKNIYIENHNLIRTYINKKNIENYIRKTVRQDNDFVFKQILNENLIKWLQLRNYYYRNCIYSNYIIFLNSFCIDNESHKCKKIIIELMEKLGFTKNQHKKKYIKYIRSID
jgi:hypothetical protein